MARRSARLLADPKQALRLGQKARQVAMEMMDIKALTDVEVGVHETLFSEVVKDWLGVRERS